MFSPIMKVYLTYVSWSIYEHPPSGKCGRCSWVCTVALPVYEFFKNCVLSDRPRLSPHFWLQTNCGADVGDVGSCWVAGSAGLDGSMTAKTRPLSGEWESELQPMKSRDDIQTPNISIHRSISCISSTVLWHDTDTTHTHTHITNKNLTKLNSWLFSNSYNSLRGQFTFCQQFVWRPLSANEAICSFSTKFTDGRAVLRICHPPTGTSLSSSINLSYS